MPEIYTKGYVEKLDKIAEKYLYLSCTFNGNWMLFSISWFNEKLHYPHGTTARL